MSGQDSSDAKNYAEGLVGRTLKGKWRLDSLLGVGGMASVFAATHRNGDRVAVKVLHPAYAVQPSVRNRFVREGYAANAVGHPGAVNVRDDEVDENGVAFLVMELLKGETLDARWERAGRLPVADVLAIAEQVLDVLAAAHDKGIWHRDIKPDNVFLTEDGRVKILDFGIAKVRDGSGVGTNVTQTGAMVGTPVFMPPEQVLSASKAVDGQSDVWAVGATMFSLLTGRFVHEALSANEVLVKAATEPARKIKTVASDVPDVVAEIVDKALLSNKAERWPNARAMQDAVRSARESLGIPAAISLPPLSLQQRRVVGLAETVDSRPGATPREYLPTHLQATTPVTPVNTEPSAERQSSPLAASAARPRATRPIWLWALGAVVVIGIGIAALRFGSRTDADKEPAPTTDPSLTATTTEPPPTTPPTASDPEVSPATTPPPASEAPTEDKPPSSKPARPAQPRPTPPAPAKSSTAKPPTGEQPSMFDKR